MAVAGALASTRTAADTLTWNDGIESVTSCWTESTAQ